ncbi:MAG: glycine cleavage system protein H [Desulfobacteraceae bacterium]|nr:glycine cleavage system protein H [Desulfobacteraceae bacterium]
MTQTMNSSRENHVWRATKDQNEHSCIWMQSGAVKKKGCNNYYDCTNCKYDHAMEKKAAAGKHISWQNAMRAKDSKDRICRHSMSQRMGMKTCPMNYNCDRCEFDQYFEDTLAPRTGHAGVHMTDVKGFALAQGFYFHQGHTWASIDSGGNIRVGLDDFSLKVLGGPDAFDLPLTGQELNQDKVGWGLKRKDNLADILSPVDGVITGVNADLFKNAGLADEDPYGDGWLFTVHNSDIKGAVKQLMDDDSSVTWTGEEVTTLENMIESVAGPMATDGGLLVSDVYGNLPTLGWNNLTTAFLRT